MEDRHAAYLLNLKELIIHNLQDAFVYTVSIYNFWQWATQGTYEYFHGWEIYNWIDFLWTMSWQGGSMYLLVRRIKYVRSKQRALTMDQEDLAHNTDHLHRIGFFKKSWDLIKTLFQ